jgi:hydroxyacylglutathione hydrolase
MLCGQTFSGRALMFFHQRFVPGLAIASYVVGDEKTRHAAVIDPTRDVEPYIELAEREGLHITHVLETHVHADYVSGSVELKARLGGKPVICSSGMGGAAWTPKYADRAIEDGDEIQLGKIRLRAIHTPGHTPEHIMWAVFDETRSTDSPWLVLSGDFLFVGDVGRPDLLGEVERQKLAHQLYTSVFNKLPALPDFAEIYPGPGAGSLCGKAIGSRRASTVGFERRFNPSLQQLPEEQWTAKLLNQMPIAPPYFKRMKQINVQGPPIIGRTLPGDRRLSAQEFHERLREHCLVLDTRPRESFATSHIPGAINIPLAPTLSTWAGWVLPPDVPILLVLANPDDRKEVVTQLMRIGLDNVEGFLEGGMEAWENSGYAIDKIERLSVAELAERLQLPIFDRPAIIDVRTPSEFITGHIDGAYNIHCGQLQWRLPEVPHDVPIVVICGTGYRASLAASILKREGYRDVSNVLGGMTAWKNAQQVVPA